MREIAFIKQNKEKWLNIEQQLTVKNKISADDWSQMYNFETLDALKRQLPYLRALAKKHVVLTIIFENTLLNNVHSQKINSTKDIYIQTIASKFVHEKQLIIQELQMHGIKTVYTKPADLSVNLLNKYLEIKRQEII